MVSKQVKIIAVVLAFIFLAGSAALYFVRYLNAGKVAAIVERNKQVVVEKPAMPDLDRPIIITAKLSQESAEKAEGYIMAAQKALKGNSDIYEEWLNLALYRKLIGDYEAAREIWEYTAKIRPSSGTALHNLGNLYAYELKELDKAEPYYLKALEIEPHNLQFYIAAYEYYRFVKKDLSKAKDILKKGIAVNPGQAQALANVLSSF